MEHEQNLSPKIAVIALTVALAILFIAMRLFYLQIELNPNLAKQSQKNCTRIEKIQSPRGNILDCSGALLATNRPITNLYWRGQGAPTVGTTQLDTLQKISFILNTPFLENEELLENLKVAERKHNKLLLAHDLTFEQLSQIQEQFATNPHVLISTHFKRYYPYQTFACHVLGYLGNIHIEPEGKMGLEKMFEDALKGEPGQALRKITSTGRSLAEVELKEALAGRDIQTTIDVDIQNICEQIFPEHNAGTFIIMDPVDGAIVALVSRPNFDPNLFLNPITPEQWQNFQEHQPFLNRAFSSSYPPGSIFKLVTASAALEQGIITQESTVFCPGYLTFAERQYWCARRTGHGRLTASQALAHSCNILFFDIAKHISIDTLANYAHKFGLGEKTAICFPEKDGLIPTSEWKKRIKKERWWPGETLSAAIGQSFLLVTPIQVACLISSIFTGYLATPRILLEETIKTKPLDIRRSTLEFLRSSMRSAVTQGTGIKVSRVKDIEIYAKTSTAQVCSLDRTAQGGTMYQEHGWFVAYFTYKDNRPLTIVVMAENVGSSRDATNLAKNFLVEYKQLMDSRKSSHNLELSQTNT